MTSEKGSFNIPERVGLAAAGLIAVWGAFAGYLAYELHEAEISGIVQSEDFFNNSVTLGVESLVQETCAGLTVVGAYKTRRNRQDG